MIHELLHDQSEPIPRQDLSLITGLDERSLLRQIARERKEGHPICASNVTGGGYFLGDSSQVKRQLLSLGSRIRELQQVRKGLKEIAVKLADEEKRP